MTRGTIERVSGPIIFAKGLEGAGLYGFDGIIRMLGLMTDANREEKDARKLIQVKGLGCSAGGCL